jgi:DNA invertase Pin-like site-specific DNA recombinase
MTLAAYIRISDPDQNIESQREAIERWLVNNGHDLKQVKWFEDQYTGRTTDRPAFRKLQAAVFNGEVKTVVIWKLNRIARSLREGVQVLGDWCNKGVRVVCITQQIDLSGTMGQILASVMFGMAEMELENNKEDQRRGIEAAQKKGVYTGRKKGTLKAKPERAKMLKAQGLTAKEIAQSLGVGESTVWRYLKEA